MIGKTLIVWLIPGAVTVTIVAGNIWMALVYATVLARLGLLDAATPLGWLPFFALLGANNMLALGVFASWLRSHQREQLARAEILAAVKWNRATSYKKKTETEEIAPSTFASRFSLSKVSPTHSFHSLVFCIALAAPATIVGAAVLS